MPVGLCAYGCWLRSGVPRTYRRGWPGSAAPARVGFRRGRRAVPSRTFGANRAAFDAGALRPPRRGPWSTAGRPTPLPTVLGRPRLAHPAGILGPPPTTVYAPGRRAGGHRAGGRARPGALYGSGSSPPSAEEISAVPASGRLGSSSSLLHRRNGATLRHLVKRPRRPASARLVRLLYTPRGRAAARDVAHTASLDSGRAGGHPSIRTVIAPTHHHRQPGPSSLAGPPLPLRPFATRRLNWSESSDFCLRGWKPAADRAQGQS